ncbi:uncharacterized protein LOC110754926 isoform X2 [Prunus avium]|uniref:Uncharacterized protein LOC110754926 isoform X2 n=1 Tax=Prunus avium TaxID=42229 RepID=A0A6P5S7L5_PRUAV|nr:uncharacterized protein LOC110754926 isoform X2 [Prunus avium]
MMGVSEHEVDEVLQHAKSNLRIAGFDEEEMRLRQRMSYRPHTLKLPKDLIYFVISEHFNFQELRGIEKNAHACCRSWNYFCHEQAWRVGIMTEMAPVGYVGISPKCILSFNKNHGQEISLRLRTDDLKGFKKYESIMPV